jgi:hypothetical protein
MRSERGAVPSISLIVIEDNTVVGTFQTAGGIGSIEVGALGSGLRIGSTLLELRLGL